MAMNRIKLLFIVAGIYDLVIGAAFFFFYDAIFTTLEMAPVGHPTYAQFPSLLVAIFGVMFLQISTDPFRFRSMMPYGISMKAAFTGVAVWSHFTVGLPLLWVPVFVCDLIFLILFVFAWATTTGLREDT